MEERSLIGGLASGSGLVTDEILKIVKFCRTVFMLTGAASPAIRIKVERLSETKSDSPPHYIGEHVLIGCGQVLKNSHVI